MMPSLARRAILALAAAGALLAGCSGPGGVFGTETYPSGNIAIATYPGGQTLDTSPKAPYSVAGGFSVSITEGHFDGPYAVTMYSWNNHFNEPCFVVHQTSPTVYAFEPGNASPIGTPATQPNPCVGGDVETAFINDNKGHHVFFSFALSKTLQAGTAPTPTPVPSASSSASRCSQGDPNSATLAVTGSQQLFTFPACNDFTIDATLPANSGAGDYLDYGISVATQFGAPTTSADGTPVFSLAFEPTPSAIAFSTSTQSVTISATSPSQFGSGTYTLELLANDAVVETVPNLTPSNDTLLFNVYPPSGTFELEEYVAILYRN